jgi:uncharacterized protein
VSSLDILLASDFHASNACFRKFLTLAWQCDAHALIVAGDWTGKRSILVSRQVDGSLQVADENGRRNISPETTQAWLEASRDRGVYVIDAIDHPGASVDDLPTLESAAMVERLQQWLDLGISYQKTSFRPLFAVPGNEDDEDIRALLSTHPWVRNVHEKVVEYMGYEIFGLGFSNVTPWKTAGELSEDELYGRLEEIARRVKHWSHAIGIIHVPPAESGLDLAPDLIIEGKALPRLASDELVPVGSPAVRTFIEKYQPLLVVSGHCHESHGLVRIGSTTCINPGSQYHTGTLAACLIRMHGAAVRGYQFLVR